MQKKIYPLFLVPSLVLFLALIFLMSCGGEGSGPDVNSSSSVDPGNPPCEGGCNDARVSITGLDTAFSGWTLRVKGLVDIDDATNQTVISKIEINLYDRETNTKIPINLNSTSFDAPYSLRDWQAGLDFTDCTLNKGRYQVYVYVYLSSSPDEPGELKKVDSLQQPFKKTSNNCRDYSLTTTVFPSAAASACQISRDKNPPYSKDQEVTLTAPATCGDYVFFNWTYESEGIPGNSKKIIIKDEESLTANFVESYNLTKDNVNSKQYLSGEFIKLGGVDAIKFTGNAFEPQGNARIIENFQSPERLINDRFNKGQLTLDERPPSDSFKTSQFVTTPNSEGAEPVDVNIETYFVVTTGSSWNTWFLLLPNTEGSCSTGANPKCISVTVWKKAS